MLRTARPADRDQIATLLTDRGEPPTRSTTGWSSTTRTPAGMVRRRGRRRPGGVHRDPARRDARPRRRPIPAGQVELVATAREYEGRGLARALMGWAHERSARRGHLVQVMIGIPYFYRQFGYQYAIALPHSRAVRAVPPPPEDTSSARRVWTTSRRWRPSGRRAAGVRPADAALAGVLAMAGRAGRQHPASRRARRHRGRDRPGHPARGRRVWLGEVAAADPARPAPCSPTPRPSPAPTRCEGNSGQAPGHGALRRLGGDALEPFLVPPPRQAARYYIRVRTPWRCWTTCARCCPPGSPLRLADDSGEIVLSFFRHHVRLAHTRAAW